MFALKINVFTVFKVFTILHGTKKLNRTKN
jgi:hypothetical protein